MQADVVLAAHRPEGDEAAAVRARRIEALPDPVRRQEQPGRNKRLDGWRGEDQPFARRRRRDRVIAALFITIMMPGEHLRSEVTERHRAVQIRVEWKDAATKHENRRQRRGEGKAGEQQQSFRERFHCEP